MHIFKIFRIKFWVILIIPSSTHYILLCEYFWFNFRFHFIIFFCLVFCFNKIQITSNSFGPSHMNKYFITSTSFSNSSILRNLLLFEMYYYKIVYFLRVLHESHNLISKFNFKQVFCFKSNYYELLYAKMIIRRKKT